MRPFYSETLTSFYRDRKFSSRLTTEAWGKTIGLSKNDANRAINPDSGKLTVEKREKILQHYGTSLKNLIDSDKKRRFIQQHCLGESIKLRVESGEVIAKQLKADRLQRIDDLTNKVQIPDYMALSEPDKWDEWCRAASAQAQETTAIDATLTGDWYCLREHLPGFQRMLMSGLYETYSFYPGDTPAQDHKYFEEFEGIATVMKLHEAFANTTDPRDAGKALSFPASKREPFVLELLQRIDLTVEDMVQPGYGIAHLLLKSPVTRELCLTSLEGKIRLQSNS